MSGCCTGDKRPVACQSDDQFFLFDYAITRGMEVRLDRKVTTFQNWTELVEITVPELNVWYAPPFDAHLHRIVQDLKKGANNARIES